MQGDANSQPVNKLPRAKREAKKGALSTTCLERSERLKRKTCQPIASSEQEAKKEDSFTNFFERSESVRRETGLPITSSKAAD